MEAAISARIAASRAPEEAFRRALLELDALGHDCTFSDEDGGDWMVRASRHLVVEWRRERDGCRVELASP